MTDAQTGKGLICPTQLLQIALKVSHIGRQARRITRKGPGIQIDKLIEKADALLYKAKSQGRNQICVEDE
jgi:GGDEF domain-containing protein